MVVKLTEPVSRPSKWEAWDEGLARTGIAHPGVANVRHPLLPRRCVDGGHVLIEVDIIL